MKEQNRIPTQTDLLWPTLKALNALGGSASIAEIPEWIAADMDLSDRARDLVHGDGPQSELAYRAAWARTWLKNIGALENSSRGIWTITKIGAEISSDEEVRDLIGEWRKSFTAQRNRNRNKNVGQLAHQKPSQEDENYSLNDDQDDSDWKERLLQVVRGIEPSAFERLCQRVLREAGFMMVTVTGRSGDGGIDGTGVLRVNLLSFHVRFQCKRYSGSVGAPEIRDFRGGLVGRADKGLFITTGRFTAEASREAVRDGATVIDLVDGEVFCDLLKQYNLGTSIKIVEEVQIDKSFFDKF